LGLILGGIFGNLSDRIFRAPSALQGEVVDWIKVSHWPTFNLADTSIVLGAAAIVVLSAKNVKPIDRNS
jgi:signal peptidase II